MTIERRPESQADRHVEKLPERPGAVSFKSVPQTIIGAALKIGDRFPAVKLVANDLTLVDLDTFSGHVRLVSVVPSLDTGVCDAQTRRFNQDAATLLGVRFITISADMPFTQKRWVADVQAQHVIMLSDHRDMAFGKAAGTYVKELRFEQRSVFVVDKNGIVTYAEYVPEIAQHPNYDAALDAVKKLL